MVIGIPRRVAGDDDVVARLQRVSRNLPLQLRGRTPFDQVAHHLAAGILHHHVDERVWIAKLERDEIASIVTD
jgi:hypothetical protein